MKDKGPLYTVVNNIIAEVVAAQGATASARLLPQYLIKYRRWAWMISIQEIVIKIFFFKYEETKKRHPQIFTKPLIDKYKCTLMKKLRCRRYIKSVF